MTIKLTYSPNMPVLGALKHFKCSKCEEEKTWVIKVEKELICVNCRYKDIGKDALYEALHNGMD